MTVTPGAAGSAAYNPSFAKIAARALRNLGVIDETEQPSPLMMEDALDKANILLKAWEAMGLHVWTEEEAIVFLQAGQARYLLGDPGGAFTPDHAADAFAWVTSTLTANAATGASTLALASAAGFANAMTLGVGLDSGATQWSSINGAPAGSSITSAAALTGPASAGARVFGYAPANAITRPLKVPDARLLTLASMSENPMFQLSRSDYMALPTKLAQGLPTNFFYAPKVSFGELFVWPVPTLSSAYAVRITWLRPIADILTQASTLDLPQEWMNPLEWCLALELGPSYEVPPVKWDRVLLMARQNLDVVQSWDRESEDVQFGVDYEGR